MGTREREKQNKLIEWKAFVDAVGIKGADLKNESLLQIFSAVGGTLM